MRDLVVATGNAGKLREIKAMLEGLPLRVLSPSEAGGLPEVVEDGETLLANAQKKARSAAAHTGLLALADDTGLEVDALDGAPGVYSARWAGEGCTYEDNNRKLLSELAARPGADRRALFKTVMVLSEPKGREDWVLGRVEGLIMKQPMGKEGFGYDPLFFVPAMGRTYGEMDLAQKNQCSHRGEALARVRKMLDRW